MPFHKSVSFRLSAVASAAIIVLLALAGFFLLSKASDSISRLQDDQLETRIESANTTVKIYTDELGVETKKLSALFGELFPEPFEIDAGSTARVGSETVPDLRSGLESVAGNYEQVDRFEKATGGNATIFVRRGDDFVRIATSVKKQDGSRAVGTTLDRQSPAYRLNIEGQPFDGKTTLFGKRFITNYTPIKDQFNQVIGIRYVGIEYSQTLEKLVAGLASKPVGDDGFIFILDTSEGSEGQIVYHPSLQGDALTGLAEVGAMLKDPTGHGRVELSWPGGSDEPWAANYLAVPELNWLVVAALPVSELEAPVEALGRIFLLAALVVAAITGLILATISRSLVSKPLNAAVGDLEAIASGDYTRSIAKGRVDEVGKLQSAMSAMQSQVSGVISGIKENAGELAGASKVLASLSGGIAEGSRDQRDAAAAMASTIEELTTNIHQLSGSAAEARELSENSQDASRRGATVIHKADKGMRGIADTVRQSSQDLANINKLSEQVATTIQVIENIAEQTNLLALNAAIESARAGEAGRGFAVVADEVRGLAGRTTQSAKEITDMISKMREGTKAAVAGMKQNLEAVEEVADMAQDAGASIEDIESGASRVFEVFSEISERLAEQSTANEYVAEHVVAIGDKAETNDNAVQQVVQSAKELEVIADRLQVMVAQFQTKTAAPSIAGR